MASASYLVPAATAISLYLPLIMGSGNKIFLLLALLVTNINAFTSPRHHRSSSISAASLLKERKKSDIGGDASEGLRDMIVDMAAVGAGAVAGAISRYQIGNIATRIIAEDKRLSPLTGWHTAAINIFGSFILGSLAGTPTIDASTTKQDAKGISPRMRLMAGVGFCGSFTTFSTFSVDIVGMLNSGKFVRAIAYATANNVGGIAAAFAGFNMAKRMIKK